MGCLVQQPGGLASRHLQHQLHMWLGQKEEKPRSQTKHTEGQGTEAMEVHRLPRPWKHAIGKDRRGDQIRTSYWQNSLGSRLAISCFRAIRIQMCVRSVWRAGWM